MKFDLKYSYRSRQAGLALLAALLLSGCGQRRAQIILKDGQQTETEEGSAKTTAAETEQAAQPQTEVSIVVDISGAVARPGVYTLPAGARVCDVIARAGGLTEEADTSALNQAALLADEDKVIVYTREELAADAGDGMTQNGATGQALQQGIQTAGEGSAIAGGSRVNINTAGVEELCTLNGIGESRAGDIIAWREQNGGFAAPEDIMQVPGIKEATYNRIKDKITVR